MRKTEAMYSEVALAREVATITCNWQRYKAGRGVGELPRGKRGGSWSALLGGCWPGEAANWNWGVLDDWLRENV